MNISPYRSPWRKTLFTSILWICHPKQATRERIIQNSSSLQQGKTFQCIQFLLVGKNLLQPSKIYDIQQYLHM
jgi:hypothetical protein